MINLFNIVPRCDPKSTIILVWSGPESNGYEGGPHIDGGARGVIDIVVGNGHGDTSSNPGQD